MNTRRFTPNLSPDTTPRFKSATAFVALAALLLLAGCNAYKVQVESLAGKGAGEAISYRIDDKRSAAGTEAPSAEQAAAYLKTALSGRGFYEAPANVKPDVVVMIDYGITPRHEQRTVPELVYPDMARYRGRTVVERGGQLESVPPPTEVRHKMIVVTTYEKYLRLTATEEAAASADRAPKHWRVDVTSTGHSDDLSKYLPVLMAASIDYVGRDSGGVKKIKLKDSDADVQFVKKGM